MTLTVNVVTVVLATITLAVLLAERTPSSVAADTVEASAYPMSQATAVDVVVIEESLQRRWKDYSGHLTAVDHVEIRPQTSGLITEVLFSPGQKVSQGDILYVIDPRPLQAEVARKQANLIVAQNSAALANKEFIRANELLATRMVSQQYYDERRNKKRIAEAAVKQAEAELSAAKIDLNYAYIKAPVSGRISRAELTQGNLVSAGAEAPLLSTIVSTGRIYADFEIDEQTYMTFMHGDATDTGYSSPVELRLQHDDDVFHGKVNAVDNEIDTASGTIRVRALFDDPQGKLLPGMYARLRLGSAQKEKTMLLPERAIATDQNRKYVYLVNTQNQAVYREVLLGDSLNGDRMIRSGLTPGDKVIVNGLMRIHPNMPVAPTLLPAMSAQAQ